MMNSSRQPRALLVHSDHSANRYDPASHRDSTPPVGAIMDIQMMHASHLFNSKSVTGKNPTPASQSSSTFSSAVPPTTSRLAETQNVTAEPRKEPIISKASAKESAHDTTHVEPATEDEEGTIDMEDQSASEGGTDMLSRRMQQKARQEAHSAVQTVGEQMVTIAEEDEDSPMKRGPITSARNTAPVVPSMASRERPSKQVEPAHVASLETDDPMEDDEVEESGEYEVDPEEADMDEDEEEYGEDDEDDFDEEAATDPDVIEEMRIFQTSFVGIDTRFRLINKIGEGTFSSVYKAEDLQYDRHENDWDFEPRSKKRQYGSSSEPHRPKYVAIKKIYVTSSPTRIQNELELLHDLTGHPDVVPLITAFRHMDQVVAILPYFQHVDFRDYFRTLTVSDIRAYFRSLFSALSHVHKHGIIHRDIKPTNFLYDVEKRKGVLVDFGLAEREGTESSYCVCSQSGMRDKVAVSANPNNASIGYPKNDSRPSRRANRAGTRGFRAPEVLFKCGNQSTKIDIWSAGVILLTILSKRFPFFNSSDDVDATIEIATIFGKAKMRHCAALHGSVFETTIPTIGEKGFTLEKIVLWATNRTGSGSGSNNKDDELLTAEESSAVRFMEECFELDPVKRISADEALEHEFLASDDVEMEGYSS